MEGEVKSGRKAEPKSVEVTCECNLVWGPKEVLEIRVLVNGWGGLDSILRVGGLWSAFCGC